MEKGKGCQPPIFVPRGYPFPKYNNINCTRLQKILLKLAIINEVISLCPTTHKLRLWNHSGSNTLLILLNYFKPLLLCRYLIFKVIKKKQYFGNKILPDVSYSDFQ